MLPNVKKIVFANVLFYRSHDAIARRKVLPFGECIRSVRLHMLPR